MIESLDLDFFVLNPLATDINLRFGSGVLHTIHAGANIPEMILQELTGKPIKTKSYSVMDGSMMTRFHEAIFDS